MGIDIYLCDHKLTEEESWYDLQRAYIRESYHGEPYPSSVLLPESFKEDNVRVTYEQLIHRMPETLKLAIERSISLYGDYDIAEAIKQYIDFLTEVNIIEEENKEAWVMNSH